MSLRRPDAIDERPRGWSWGIFEIDELDVATDFRFLLRCRSPNPVTSKHTCGGRTFAGVDSVGFDLRDLIGTTDIDRTFGGGALAIERPVDFVLDTECAIFLISSRYF